MPVKQNLFPPEKVCADFKLLKPRVQNWCAANTWNLMAVKQNYLLQRNYVLTLSLSCPRCKTGVPLKHEPNQLNKPDLFQRHCVLALTFSSPVITICTTCVTTLKCCILHTVYLCVPYGLYNKQQQSYPDGICYGDNVSCTVGTLHYLEEIVSSKRALTMALQPWYFVYRITYYRRLKR
jgi:hypothetical protein